MTDEISASDPPPGAARQALADLRPQVYGKGSPAAVLDPIVEPLWTGIRVLASVDASGVVLIDADGYPLEGFEPIAEALAAATPAGEVVVDAVLTKQATRAASPVVAWSDEMPSIGSFVGLRRNRAVDTLKLREKSLDDATFEPDDVVTLVATDLLWLDETSLIDVPLLERRRLLEAVVIESDEIRIGAFVRPPIERWVASWRSQGFSGLTYKAANSRYTPGRPNPDWVIGGMPRR
jgi:ATP-dependent DNA ligase